MADGKRVVEPLHSFSNSEKENKVPSGPKVSFALDETSPLLEPPRNIQCYKRRWYVLGVFSYAALLQTATWNTFGPIAQSAKAVFGWSDANIGMLSNWGNIMYVVFMFPVAWLMDVKGLRVSMLLCSVLLVFTTAIRCITSEPVPATWLMNIAALVVGVAGTVPMAGPALLSATWFAPAQRTTATAVSTVFSFSGIAVGFVIGPLLVPQPDEPSVNMTDIRTLNSSSLINNSGISLTPAANISEVRSGIMRLMYTECAACVLLLLLVVVYFPAKPPSPPSLTASIERTRYLQGIKGLFTHRRFWVIMVTFSVPTGVYRVFGAVLDVVLDGVGVSQYHAGWIGFYATIGGCVAALVMSRYGQSGREVVVTKIDHSHYDLQLDTFAINDNVQFSDCNLSDCIINPVLSVGFFFEWLVGRLLFIAALNNVLAICFWPIHVTTDID